MKRTIYIINAIIFIGCCLLVSTTVPNVKSIDVNKQIAYVNSNTITKEKTIETVKALDVVEEPKVVEEIKKAPPKEEPKKEIVVGKDEVIDDNIPLDNESTEVETIPTINVGTIFTGTMSGYGADIGEYTASGHYIGDDFYYQDHTYGNIRILAGDKSIPFGTIIRVNNSKIGSFLGIVLDTGRNIGFQKLYDFDLLYETSKEAYKYGVSKNVTFEILRVGY